MDIFAPIKSPRNRHSKTSHLHGALCVAAFLLEKVMTKSPVKYFQGVERDG
jgi:hypothetical protein